METAHTSFVGLLRACAKNKNLYGGKKVHADVVKWGLLGESPYVAEALVNMYSKCGVLAKAHDLLDGLDVRDVVSWTSVIAGYAEQGQGKNALNCFERMQQEGLSPDAVTFVCLLKACGSIKAAEKGEQFHDEVARQGLLGKNIVLGNALVDMYAKCGALGKAQRVFDALPKRNVICWNALITGYAKQGEGKKALSCFEKMQHEGLSPVPVTFTCLLKACGSIGDAEKGGHVHDEIARRGLLRKNIVIATALVDMYARCGALAKAQQVLEELPTRDVFSWSALITGYTDQGHGEKALKCYEQMHREGLSPDAVTYLCILKACGSIGAGDKGEQVHDEIIRQGLLRNNYNIVLGTALVDMYSKCGALAKAQQLLEELAVGDVVSWSALITGYAQQGHGEDALTCFYRMRSKGLSPDAIAFSCVLNACSHSGLVKEGQIFFEEMSSDFGIKQDLEHYICIVDLLGHAGNLGEAVAVIQRMPSSDCPAIWSTLLGACRKWGDVNVGRWAFEHAIQIDNSEASTYLLMANIYAAAGMQEDAELIEVMRVRNNAQKKLGCSWWVDKSGSVYSFPVGDKKPWQREPMVEDADDISNKGHFSTLPYHRVKKDFFCGHSVMSALACALSNTPEGETVRIVSTLQMCSDCHIDVSRMSKMKERKIVVRDENCAHVFENGGCCCG